MFLLVLAQYCFLQKHLIFIFMFRFYTLVSETKFISINYLLFFLK